VKRRAGGDEILGARLSNPPPRLDFDVMLDRLRAGEFALSVTSIDSGRGNLSLDKRLVIHAVHGFNQLITQDGELSGGLDPDPHLVALYFHDRDLDVWTDHDRL
jgi:hypothetical protein